MARHARRRKQGRWRQQEDKVDATERLVTVLNPSSAASEAYRSLRTNLLYSIVDNPPKVIVLTSPHPNEGKSTTCANLGVVLTQADKQVLMVDCDFRKPSLHRIFGIRNIWGIVNILAGEQSLQESSQEPLPGLKLLTTGSIPSNPMELLGSQRFAEFLTSVRENFDYILLDAPPVELVSDPMILAFQGDGVMLIVDAQNTRKGTVRRSMHSLETVGANVFCTVMNNVKSSRGRYYGYGYGYNED